MENCFGAGNILKIRHGTFNECLVFEEETRIGKAKTRDFVQERG
jgi:hypothetical protein